MNITKVSLVLITLVFAYQSQVDAAFYTWEDETGTTHITDYPPTQVKSGEKVKVHEYDSDTSSAIKDEEQASKSKTENKPEVALYTKNDCNDCNKAREFLKAKKIFFTEYNIETDKDAAARRKKIDDSEDVPFAIINRNQVYGFSESVYNRALKLNP